MATTAVIPVSEYLSSSYEPDCDYVDGELQERNLGELQHGVLQALVAAIFNAHGDQWNVFAGTEVRMRVSGDRYRIPDVCVLRDSDPFTPVLTKAPLICIEILSSEDRLQRMQERVDDYLRFGVEHILIVNPNNRRAWVALPDGELQHISDEFIIAGTTITISLKSLFDRLDRMQAKSQS